MTKDLEALINIRGFQIMMQISNVNTVNIQRMVPPAATTVVNKSVKTIKIDEVEYVPELTTKFSRSMLHPRDMTGDS